MEPRTIAIGLIAVVAAFGAAFGITSARGGEKKATPRPRTKADTNKAPPAAAVAGVQVSGGGALPALKAEKKKAKKKAANKPSSNSTASAPSTNNSSQSQSQSQTQAPSTQNSAPAPQNSAPAPRPSAPKPSAPKPSGPIKGGGEDG